jgi:hypothetical protein
MKFPSTLVAFFFLSSHILAVMQAAPTGGNAPTVVYVNDCNDTKPVLPQCKQTKVVVLGAGVAGITAAVSMSLFAPINTLIKDSKR